MPILKKRQKISKRLIVYIILFSSMITAIVTVVQLYYQYIEDKSLLDSNIRNINTGYREGITNAVWLDDKVQLDSILDGVVALPDIEYIEVRVNNRLYSSRGSSVKSNALSNSFPLRYLHDYKLLTIGKTYVQADLSAIYRRLIKHAWAILGLNAIKTFIVAIFMYFIFNRLVVVRLEGLSNFVRQYDIHALSKEVTIPPFTDNSHPDEITEIALALNTMQNHLSQSVKEIQTSLEEARAANTELESFSYSISHDLRAPLRSIDGFSHLLLDEYGEKINNEGKDYIRRVRKNAQHMGLLIDDMLSLSKVTRGDLNRTVCNLSEIADTAIKKLQDSEPQRTVNVHISPGIRGWVDKSLFESLMDNLIGNAWKYTNKSEDPRIEFGSTTQNNEAVYFVRDNGAGFDMQYANKLFNAFQRLHGVEEFPGTGIGLATVSRILQRHGGRIWPEAEVGKGATFYFTLGNNHPL
jgi:signal transduction histidine kinase